MSRFVSLAALAALVAGLFAGTGLAQAPAEPAPAAAAPATPPPPDPTKTPLMKSDLDGFTNDLNAGKFAGTHKYADIAWMLTSSALVMLMMPGLALFYGGMARRKNVLGTMMHTMVALGHRRRPVGGHRLLARVRRAGPQDVHLEGRQGRADQAGVIGFSKELLFLSPTAAVSTSQEDELKAKKIDPKTATDDQKADADKEVEKKNKFNTFPNTNLPLYVHAMFQGMFAIITIALVSGAFAERVKFGAYCLFALLWTTIVYDPIAHWVWSFEWVKPIDETTEKAAELFPAAGLHGGQRGHRLRRRHRRPHRRRVLRPGGDPAAPQAGRVRQARRSTPTAWC